MGAISYHVKLNDTYASRKKLPNSFKNLNAGDQPELFLTPVKLIEGTFYRHSVTSD